MTINTVIHIPLHVTQEKIILVLLKSMGYQLGVSALNKKENIDFNIEPSSENPWYYKVNINNHIDISSNTNDILPDSVWVNFVDIAGSNYRWFYSLKDEFDEYQTFLPGCNEVAVAVGAKLVKFFGGEVISNDSNENGQGKLIVKNSKALHGKFNGDKTNSEDSNKHYWNFYKELFHLQPINIKDLDNDGYSNERSEKLKVALQNEFLCNELKEKIVDVTIDIKKNKVKI